MRLMRIGILVMFFFFGHTLSAQDGKSATVNMEFEKDHVDLGKINRGDQQSFAFVFTNTGSEDIKIDLVSACECTTADWTRKMIKPGEQGKISLDFDSTEKEKSETVEVFVDLRNIDPETDAPIFKILTFSFEFIE